MNSRLPRHHGFVRLKVDVGRLPDNRGNASDRNQTPLCVSGFEVIVRGSFSRPPGAQRFTLTAGPGAAYPKSRCMGVSRSRGSQSRSLFSLPGSPEDLREKTHRVGPLRLSVFPAARVWLGPLWAQGRSLRALRPTVTSAAGGAHGQLSGNDPRHHCDHRRRARGRGSEVWRRWLSPKCHKGSPIGPRRDPTETDAVIENRFILQVDSRPESTPGDSAH